MSKGRFRGWAAVLAAVLTLGLVLSACGGDDDDDGGNGETQAAATDCEGQTVGLSLLNLVEPFLQDLAEGAEAKAEEYGWTMDVQSADGDLAGQVTQVENFITNDYGAIILNPVDSDGIIPAVLRANEAGIPVFTTDIRANGGEVISHVASDNEEGGRMLGELTATEILNEQGQVGILSFDQISSVADRVVGFEKALANYPNIEVVQKLETDFTRDAGRTNAENMIAGNPELDVIFGSVGGDAGIGARQAIEQAGEDIRVVTFDSIPEARELMVNKDPILVADLAQFPYLMGQEVVEAVNNYCNGEQLPEFQAVDIALVTPADIVEQGGTLKIKGHEADEP
jgi:ribose transport system substrate-binding protein